MIPKISALGAMLLASLSAAQAGYAQSGVVSAGKFVVVVAPAGTDMDTVSLLAETADRAVQELSDQFVGGPDIPVRLEIAATPAEFIGRGGMNGLMIGVARDNGSILMQTAPVLRKTANLPNALKHEIAHLFVGNAAGRNCPRWLHEAAAMLLSGWPAISPSRKNRFSPVQLEALDGELLAPKTRAALREAYRDVAAIAYLLDRRIGARRLIQQLGDLKQRDIGEWRVGKVHVLEALQDGGEDGNGSGSTKK